MERVAWPRPKKVAVAVIKVSMMKSILAGRWVQLLVVVMLVDQAEVVFPVVRSRWCTERSIAEPCVAKMTAVG